MTISCTLQSCEATSTMILLHGDLALDSIHKILMHNAWNQFHKEVNMLISQCTEKRKSTAKKGQVMEVHLDILGQRSLRAMANYRQPFTSAQKEKQFGMTYIKSCQNLASGNIGRRGKKGEKREGERVWERGESEREGERERQTVKVLIWCVFGANNRIHRKRKWASLQFIRSADSTKSKVQQYPECTSW